MASCQRSHIEFRERDVQPERVRPCRIVIDDENDFDSFRRHFKVVRPLCCYGDSHQILVIMACAALLYSIVSLVLTSIYSPNAFFITVLSFSIITMIMIIAGAVSGKNLLLKIAFVMTGILTLLACAGAVYCLIYVIHNFHLQFGWRWKFYIISMLVAQVCMIFYIISLLCLTSEIIAYRRRVREEEQCARTIPVWRKY